jgi:hypothetical protein
MSQMQRLSWIERSRINDKKTKKNKSVNLKLALHLNNQDISLELQRKRITLHTSNGT